MRRVIYTPRVLTANCGWCYANDSAARGSLFSSHYHPKCKYKFIARGIHLRRGPRGLISPLCHGSVIPMIEATIFLLPPPGPFTSLSTSGLYLFTTYRHVQILAACEFTDASFQRAYPFDTLISSAAVLRLDREKLISGVKNSLH